MELHELYHLIGLQDEIIQKLKAVREEIHLDQINVYWDQLMDGKTAAQSYEELKTVLAEDADNLKMLYCQLECARRVFDRYQEKHIPQTIYIESMKCFSRFMEECKRKNGRLFFDRGWWTYRQLSMKIFHIGELEYEFKAYEGEKVIGIHVPSDANLSGEAVDNSLKQADMFFHTYYGSYPYKKYTCNSWLLSPALKPLLPETSNIASFQDRFEIILEDKADREYIEWLFQVPSNTDYESLPAETSLQKKVKKLLLNGGTVGRAYGKLCQARNCA